MSRLRYIVPLLGVAVLIGAIYDGAIFYSRWNGNRQAERAQAERDADHARKIIDMAGGGGLKIIGFYAVPGAIRRGGSTTICYGVTGAKTVRIEPAIQTVWPSMSRCMQASPVKDTEYKLIAVDGEGRSTTGSLVVKVR
jgi:hypothetical protein